MEDKINLTTALASFEETWDPRIVATLNDYEIKVVHIAGEFTWHSHTATDEMFLLLAGSCQIHLRDRTIDLEVGDVYVVPKGVEHKPESKDGADILLIEPGGTPNTGDEHEAIPDHIAVSSGRAL